MKKPAQPLQMPHDPHENPWHYLILLWDPLDVDCTVAVIAAEDRVAYCMMKSATPLMLVTFGNN